MTLFLRAFLQAEAPLCFAAGPEKSTAACAEESSLCRGEWRVLRACSGDWLFSARADHAVGTHPLRRSTDSFAHTWHLGDHEGACGSHQSQRDQTAPAPRKNLSNPPAKNLSKNRTFPNTQCLNPNHWHSSHSAAAHLRASCGKTGDTNIWNISSPAKLIVNKYLQDKNVWC